MMTNYLDQLEAAAADAGVDLLEAVRAANMPDSTLWRWRNGRATPREATCSKIMDAIKRLKVAA